MAKFTFRLEKLMSYRRTVEQRAKDDYLARRAKRIEGEIEIEKIKQKRLDSLLHRYATLADLQAHERYLTRLDDDQRAVQAALSVLEGEEEIARQQWLAKKRDVDSLEKLRDKALVEWNVEQDRAEQRALDEWAVTRRAS